MNIIQIDEVESTNLWMKRHYDSLDHPCCVVASSQSAGRGRRGRTWHSPPGNLYLTYTYKESPPQHGLVPLVAAVAIVTALRDQTRAALKWPNDIMVGENKIGGVLCESIFDGSEWHGTIVGVGLNIAFSPDLPGTISLADLLPSPPAVARIAELIIASTEELVAGWHNGLDVLEPYRRLSSSIGRSVNVQLGEETFRGTVVDVDASGRLVVTSDGESRSFDSGEVVHIR